MDGGERDSQTSKYNLGPVSRLGMYRKNAMLDRIFDRCFPELSNSSEILEIGTGRGEFARKCKDLGYVYTGIEPSTTQAAVLVSEGFNIINKTVPPLDLIENQFDLVHSMDVIEHLGSYKEVLELMADCRRVLRPGGYISVIAPNYSTLKELFFEYEYQHTYPTTVTRIIQVLEDTGFKIVKHRKFFSELGLTNLLVIDRMLAHIVIPVVRNSIFCALIKLLANQNILGKIHKNVYDHVSVLGQKVDP